MIKIWNYNVIFIGTVGVNMRRRWIYLLEKYLKNICWRVLNLSFSTALYHHIQGTEPFLFYCSIPSIYKVQNLLFSTALYHHIQGTEPSLFYCSIPPYTRYRTFYFLLLYTTIYKVQTFSFLLLYYCLRLFKAIV